MLSGECRKKKRIMLKISITVKSFEVNIRIKNLSVFMYRNQKNDEKNGLPLKKN